jgi:DNA-binding CsgD family transcriptional regulator
MREVEALMREGFGVEDIAVKLGINPELVRRHVKRLRARGEIKTIYRAWSLDRARLEMKRSEGGVPSASRT